MGIPLEALFFFTVGLQVNVAFPTVLCAQDLYDGILLKTPPFLLRPKVCGWLQACKDGFKERGEFAPETGRSSRPQDFPESLTPSMEARLNRNEGNIEIIFYFNLYIYVYNFLFQCSIFLCFNVSMFQCSATLNTYFPLKTGVNRPICHLQALPSDHHGTFLPRHHRGKSLHLKNMCPPKSCWTSP